MKIAKKTKRREKLLDSILKHMMNHTMFSDKVSRTRDTESMIQKNLFLYLEDEDRLKKCIEDYGMTDKKSAELAASFQWEQKKTTTVKNFSVFSTNHRPDAVLDMEDFRIGIEIKKGDSGTALRSGLGQCLIYGSEFDFAIYLFVDMTDNRNILKSLDGERERKIINDLWDNYNVKFDIV